MLPEERDIDVAGYMMLMRATPLAMLIYYAADDVATLWRRLRYDGAMHINMRARARYALLLMSTCALRCCACRALRYTR